MSKTLFLMRHGKAEKNDQIPDIERSLTDRGMRDARRQAESIFKDQLPDKFLVSSAARTIQTSMHIKEAIDFDESLLQFEPSMYLASVRELFDLVANLDDLWKTVCLIGHNPSTNYLAEYLTGDDVDFLKTSGVIKITFDGSWAEISQGSAYFEYNQPPS